MNQDLVNRFLAITNDEALAQDLAILATPINMDETVSNVHIDDRDEPEKQMFAAAYLAQWGNPELNPKHLDVIRVKNVSKAISNLKIATSELSEYEESQLEVSEESRFSSELKDLEERAEKLSLQFPTRKRKSDQVKQLVYWSAIIWRICKKEGPTYWDDRHYGHGPSPFVEATNLVLTCHSLKTVNYKTLQKIIKEQDEEMAQLPF